MAHHRRAALLAWIDLDAPHLEFSIQRACILLYGLISRVCVGRAGIASLVLFAYVVALLLLLTTVDAAAAVTGARALVFFF